MKIYNYLLVLSLVCCQIGYAMDVNETNSNPTTTPMSVSSSSKQVKQERPVFLVSETAKPCDLTDPAVLIPLLDPLFQGDGALIHFAINWLSSFEIRAVGGQGAKYGQQFYPDQEVLMTLMRQAKGKVVCELAAASGINSVFLALAGAKLVYVNEYYECELRDLAESIEPFSQIFKERLRFVPGDCFEVMKEFYGTCDIVYARNFIHLLKSSRFPDFFGLLKDILNPKGGTVVLTAHGGKENNVWRPKTKTLLGYCKDEEKGIRLDTDIKYCLHIPSQEDSDPLEFVEHSFLLNRIKSQGKKKDATTLIQKDGVPLSEDVMKFIKTNRNSIIKDIKAYQRHQSSNHVNFTVLCNFKNFFSPESLYGLCRSHNFDPVAAYLTTQETGHIVREDELGERAIRVTVFAKIAK